MISIEFSQKTFELLGIVSRCSSKNAVVSMDFCLGHLDDLNQSKDILFSHGHSLWKWSKYRRECRD